MKLFTNPKSGVGKDKGKAQTTIEIPEKETRKIDKKFYLSLYFLVILGFWICAQALVTFGISEEANEKSIASNVGYINHAATFPILVFNPAAKPNKEFWRSIKPTVQYDKEKRNAACSEGTGSGLCGTFPGKEARDNLNCTIYTLRYNATDANETDFFDYEMDILNTTNCNVVAYVDKLFGSPHPIQQWNPRFTIVNLDTEEGEEALMKTKGSEWFVEVEIDYVDKDTIAGVEAKVRLFTRMGQLKINLQVEKMEEISERVLKFFEKIQKKGFRLFKTNFSCSGAGEDDCVAEYSFVNANYWWEFISVLKEDKAMQEQ